MRAEEFVTYVIARLGQAYSATQHRMSNVAIEFDEGNRSAICEAYVRGFHMQQTDAAPNLHTFNGRCIDRFERGSEAWKIATRTLRVEWSGIETLAETMGGGWVESGRDHNDVVYQRP